MNRRAIGSEGERAACEYLRQNGWTIVETNVRRGRGEIDIVARNRKLTAFVEVKRRSSLRYGQPAEAVNLEKRRRIAGAAALYMQEHGLERVRFDVIEILPDGIRHIESAFDATDLF